MDQNETWREGRPRPMPHCVRWRLSFPQKGHSPQFLASPKRGTAPNFWPMSVVAKRLWYGGRPRPRRLCVRWEPSPPKKGHSPPIFSPCLFWPNGSMDEDATSYGGRPQPRQHCVRWGPSSPSKGAQPPSVWPMSIVAKRLDASGYHLVRR